MPRDMQFLVEEHRTDLVHRDGRGEGGKYQQRMKANARLNTLGRVMKMSDGPLSGWIPTEKAAGKIISPARIAMMESKMAICPADRNRLIFLSK